jgi:hypothetical protein
MGRTKPLPTMMEEGWEKRGTMGPTPWTTMSRTAAAVAELGEEAGALGET